MVTQVAVGLHHLLQHGGGRVLVVVRQQHRGLGQAHTGGDAGAVALDPLGAGQAAASLVEPADGGVGVGALREAHDQVAGDAGGADALDQRGQRRHDLVDGAEPPAGDEVAGLDGELERAVGGRGDAGEDA
jgi:hypothetical protein